MSSLRDEILGISNTKGIIIEQKLNKLFYEKPKIDEESRFIKLVLSKNGFNQDRAGLHASAIIASEDEFCYREQILSLFFQMSQGENIPIKLKRIFEEGNSIHEKWQRLIVRGGLGKPENMDRTSYCDKYDLSYTPDIRCMIHNKKYIGEIKSVNTFQFKKMKSHPSGAKQLKLYMHLTGVHDGFVLCEDKNTQDIKVFTPEYNEDDLAPYIERLEAIQEYKDRFINEKRMVKRKCSSPSCKRASKCNMKDACWNIGIGRKKL